MKKILMMMVVGYLVISVLIAAGYNYVMNQTESVMNQSELVTVTSDSETESPEEEPVIRDTADTMKPEISEVEEDDSLHLMAVITKSAEVQMTPTVLPIITEAVQVSAAPTEAPEVSAIPEISEVPTAIPEPEKAEPTAEPTKTVKVTPKAEDPRESVKCNGVELFYEDTSYRMDAETVEELTALIDEEPYLTSFVLYDIESKAMICYNETKYFPVASTVKAPFAMTCLWQIEGGEYSLEDTMEYTSEYKVRGDGVIKKENLGTVYTIKELVEHAILISDDIGYLMLQGYFGHEVYNEFLKGMGNRVTIDGKNVKWGHTSTLDSLRNWQEIYRYINSERENASFFAELLKNTNKSYIRNVLGDEYVIYNKMGWVYDQCCHDHAIVMDEQPYLMMIMTMGDVRADNQEFMEDLASLLNEVHEEMVYIEVQQEESAMQ